MLVVPELSQIVSHAVGQPFLRHSHARHGEHDRHLAARHRVQRPTRVLLPVVPVDDHDDDHRRRHLLYVGRFHAERHARDALHRADHDQHDGDGPRGIGGGGGSAGVVSTETYIFPNDVINQPANPAGFPTTWGSETADYAMDPRITTDPTYRNQLVQDLLSLPTMSIVTDEANLFDPTTGIYANATNSDMEVPASLEYFDPATGQTFQINAALRMQGGVGRYAGFEKHSFRFVFKAPYGPSKLDFPLFGDGATDSFDTVTLRANFNDAWVWGQNQAQYIRDQFADETLLAMGEPASHGNYVQLYVNGLYWGLYNPTERPDTSFAAAYLGGDKDNWDAIERRHGGQQQRH